MILFAARQLFGGRIVQEDYFTYFSDECFVVTDGVSGVPYGSVAAKLASETALWAYKHVRQRKFYWGDKKLLLKRIFRTSNLTVWQKKREPGFEKGFLTTLLVAIIGPQNIWIGSVGDSSAYICHDRNVQKLIHEERDTMGNLTNAVGVKRLGLVPQIQSRKFYPDDCLLLATDGVANYINANDILTACNTTSMTIQSLEDAVEYLLRIAQEKKSHDNMTVCMIKRVGNR